MFKNTKQLNNALLKYRAMIRKYFNKLRKIK